MDFAEHPRLLARLAGVFYMIIIASAIFAYQYVRGRKFFCNAVGFLFHMGGVCHVHTILAGSPNFLPLAQQLIQPERR